MPTESRIRVAQALHAVFGRGSRVPDAWDEGLEHDDAGFAQALLGLCLRRWGRLQAYVQPKLKESTRSLPLGTQVSLAIGFAQLAWLSGVSDHAGVNEAVELVGDRALGFPPHKGLVNALLRAGARERDNLKNQLDALPASLDRTPFAERTLRQALAPRHNEGELETLWAKLQEPARPLFRSVKEGSLPPGLEPDPDLEGALSLSPDAPFPRTWLSEGAGMVQDRSSQALMQFSWDRPVGRIADLCAAPGGKTTALALRWPKAELFAIEQHSRRARRLEENLQVRGIKARIHVTEAANWLQSSDLNFDLILLDAPCSGSGTFRKHPELTWLGDGINLHRLMQTQRLLLTAAISRLAPGGLLVYSACSWLPEEGVALRSSILDSHPSLKPAAVWPGIFGDDPTSPTSIFRPDPLNWDGEGFQAFALTRD